MRRAPSGRDRGRCEEVRACGARSSPVAGGTRAAASRRGAAFCLERPERLQPVHLGGGRGHQRIRARGEVPRRSSTRRSSSSLPVRVRTPSRMTSSRTPNPKRRRRKVRRKSTPPSPACSNATQQRASGRQRRPTARRCARRRPAADRPGVVFVQLVRVRPAWAGRKPVRQWGGDATHTHAHRFV